MRRAAIRDAHSSSCSALARFAIDLLGDVFAAMWRLRVERDERSSSSSSRGDGGESRKRALDAASSDSADSHPDSAAKRSKLSSSSSSSSSSEAKAAAPMQVDFDQSPQQQQRQQQSSSASSSKPAVVFTLADVIETGLRGSHNRAAMSVLPDCFREDDHDVRRTPFYAVRLSSFRVRWNKTSTSWQAIRPGCPLARCGIASPASSVDSR